MGKITHWYIFDVPDKWQSDEPGEMGASPHTIWFEAIQLFLSELISYLEAARPVIMPGLTIKLPTFQVRFGNAVEIYWKEELLATFPVHYKTMSPHNPRSLFPGAQSQVRLGEGTDPQSAP